MAQVAEAEEITTKTDVSTAPQEPGSTDSKPPRGKVGRPAGTVGAEMRQRGTLPPVEGGAFTIPFQDACNYTAKLTERDWAHVEGYVFRLKPRILRLPPLSKNIGFISAPVTKEWMLENFGSGKYQIRLNDTDKDNKKGIFESFPEFDEPDYPPKYDIRELDIAHRENRQLVEHLKRTGKLTAEGDVINAAPSGNSDAAMADALKTVAMEAMKTRSQGDGAGNNKMVEMFANASTKAIEIATSQLKKEDPAALLAMMVQMKDLLGGGNQMQPFITLLTTMITQMNQPKGDDSMVKLLMQELQAARTEAAEERKRVHELNVQALKAREIQSDPFKIVDTVLSLQEKLSGNQPDKRNWKEKLVDDGLQFVPDLIGLAKQALGGGYKRAGAPDPNVRPNAPGGPQTVEVRPIAAAAAPDGMPTGADPNMQQAHPDADVEYLIQVFLKFGDRLVAAFKEDPNSGADVAQAVSSRLMAGKAGYEKIARMGRDKILLAIGSIPQMQQEVLAVGTAEMLADFIDDFVAFGEPPDDDENDDDNDGESPDQPEVPEPAAPSRPIPVAKRKAAKVN